MTATSLAATAWRAACAGVEPSSRATAKAPLKAPPAPVVSTTSTGAAGESEIGVRHLVRKRRIDDDAKTAGSGSRDAARDGLRCDLVVDHEHAAVGGVGDGALHRLDVGLVEGEVRRTGPDDAFIA